MFRYICGVYNVYVCGIIYIHDGIDAVVIYVKKVIQLNVHYVKTNKSYNEIIKFSSLFKLKVELLIWQKIDCLFIYLLNSI